MGLFKIKRPAGAGISRKEIVAFNTGAFSPALNVQAF